MIIWERKFYRDTVHADIEIKGRREGL